MKARLKIRAFGMISAFLVAVFVLIGAETVAQAAAAAPVEPTPPAIYLPMVKATIRGNQFVELGAPGDLAVVSEPYSSTVKALVYHEAYTVTNFLLVEEDAFGVTSPQIGAGGVVTWLPSAADVGVHRYLLTAVVNDGSTLDREVTIEVAPRTQVITATVGALGGTVADPGGDYAVTIPANAVAEDAANVGVRVSVVKRADGNVQLNTGIEGLRPDAVPTFAGPLYAVEEVTETLPAGSSCAELPFITALNPDPLKWKGGLVHVASAKRLYKVIEQNMTNVTLRDQIWMTNYPALPDRGMAELRGSCNNNCVGKQAVLFVHGYVPLGGLGGGTGTWGCSFNYVQGLGGAAYEFRWRTNQRFEDAAYALAQAIARVTELTGRKPLVVGHSMGGILITTYLAGLAEMPDAAKTGYVSIGYDSPDARGGKRSAAVAGALTVSSPLSGIASPEEGKTYNLPQGRDVHPTALTILACNDLTCGESGLSTTDLTFPGTWVDQQKVDDFLALFGWTLDAPGSLIHKLYAKWQGPTMPDLHYDVLVSAWYTPNTADWVDADWGDGLIAVTGMQVLPTHFVGKNAQGTSYNYIRTNGRALTAAEKITASIPANLDYTFMLTPSLTGGYYGFPHTSMFNKYATAWWWWYPNPNAPAVDFPQGGKLDFHGEFLHSLKPVLDRAYAAAAQQAPIFTSTASIGLIIRGLVLETSGSLPAVQPLANAPVLFVVAHNGEYRGMVQSTTDANGGFAFDLGSLLDDYGIAGRQGVTVHVRVGNDTTHDAATLILTSDRLDAETQLGPIVLPVR